MMGGTLALDFARPYGKAQLCEWLHGRLYSASVPESHLVWRADWLLNRSEILDALLDRYRPPLIVRSSAPCEDRVESSQAGRFLSVSSVASRAHLEAAVDAVFRSYGRETPDDVSFVQEMVTDVDCVGVAFNADPETGSPYLIVNYAETNRTDAITSGRDSYSTWIALGRGMSSPPLPALQRLPEVVSEIQAICGLRNLDVEFAVAAGQIHVLQVRELATTAPAPPELGALTAAVTQAGLQMQHIQARAPGLLGKSTAFGVMPDWNPAEIIGIRPRPLAVSMYRALVTDRHWSKRRGDYGYRAVSDTPLLHEVLGVPYIDVRASFNSLVPATLSDKVAGDFIDAALQRLAGRRELHDKVEFAILPTCYTADLEHVLTDRFSGTLPQSHLGQIAHSLRELTRALLENAPIFDGDEQRQVSQLKDRRKQHRRKLTIDRLAALLSDAATLGATPFVGHARRAFIAMDILRSLVRTGALTYQRFSAFLASIDTVAARFQRHKSRLPRKDLLRAYGHLRPGTYDITAPRYDQLPQSYLTATIRAAGAAPGPFVLLATEARAIDAYLRRLGAGLSADEFIRFAATSIAAREETKFEFTKNISEALELIAELFRQRGFTREDASFLRLEDILSGEFDRRQVARVLSDRRTEYATASAAQMPLLVFSPDDLWSFTYGEGQPNYIGRLAIIGRPVRWPTSEPLDGAILMIENADPGFDWIFGTNIAGFVTMFGGPNSHMAIRAHELGVTAVVGAGPTLFNRWRRAGLLRIDPSVRTAEVVP
jgi:hypothetical protein